MLKFSGGAIVPGVSRARAIVDNGELPSQTDVVVIGGGLLGCIAALNLAERGVPVTVCEKGVIAGEASGRAAGLIEYEHLASIKLELIARSMELWRDMPTRIERDIGYFGGGLVTLYDNDTRAAAAASWLDTVRGQPGVDARMLSGAEITKTDAALGSSWQGALLQANGAVLEPRLAAPAIAEAAMDNGATIVQNCAVRGIERQAGAISGVVTEKGTIKTTNVIIASGVWSSMLARQLDLELPQLTIFAEMISVEPLTDGPAVAGMTPAGYFRREPDGGYMFGTATGVIPITPTILKNLPKLMAMPTDVDQEMIPVFNFQTFCRELAAGKAQVSGKLSAFEKTRIFQPEVIGKTSTDTYEGMRKCIPAFSQSKIRERYSGALVTTLDNLGVISPVKSIPGLYLGTGMLYGLTMGAAAGEALADMICGEKPKFDVTPYRYERFGDGSKFEFHA